MSAAPPAIELIDVSVGYGGGVAVLAAIDLRVELGEVVGVVGPNGAGKSTLVRTIAGLLEYHGGAVRDGVVNVLGDDAATSSAAWRHRRGLATALSGRRLFASMTVEQHLQLAVDRRRRRRGASRAAARELFPRLDALWSTPVGFLSGGEQQMVAVAMALARRPAVVVLDEPAVGLAPDVVADLGRQLRRLAEDGSAVLVLEHDHTTIEGFTDRVMQLAGGELHALPASSASPETANTRPSGMRCRRMTDRAKSRVTTLDVVDLSYSVGGVQVLADVDLSVARGQVVGVVGPNGAGKTSLLDCISGFAPYQRGAVYVTGRRLPVGRVRAAAVAGVARTFQQPVVFGGLTVEENLLTAFHDSIATGLFRGAVPHFGDGEDTAKTYVRRIGGALHLTDVQHTRAAVIPAGHQKRVDLARALLRRPALLLVDEPTAGLSCEESRLVATAIADFVQSTGAAAVIVDHDSRFVHRLCDEVVVLDQGAIRATAREAG